VYEFYQTGETLPEAMGCSQNGGIPGRKIAPHLEMLQFVIPYISQQQEQEQEQERNSFGRSGKSLQPR